MIAAILLGLLRHLLTVAAGALLNHGLQYVGGLVQVQDLESTVIGGVLGSAALALSAAQKIKTKSGPDYSGLNK